MSRRCRGKQSRCPASPLISRAATALICLALALLAAGCSARKVQPVTGPKANPASLSFLVDGRTARAEAEAVLGEPSRRFESGRVLTYRLDPDYQTVDSLTEARYSLILVFDADGVLHRHGLVMVR
jgi:hypothetical protein